MPQAPERTQGSNDEFEFVVDEDIVTAQSLPPGTFRSERFARREQDSLFANGWSLLPDLEVPAKPFSRVPFEMGGSPYFLQRGETDVRLFPNVCTHAWYTLVSKPDCGKALACPQHGRSFDTAGKCLGQPHLETPGFPNQADDLSELPIEQFGPLQFFSSGEAPPLEALLGPIQNSLGDLPLDDLQLIPGGSSVREVEGNWKQHSANFLDRLHIPFLHGGLGKSIDMSTYTTEIHDNAVLQYVETTEDNLAFDERIVSRFAGKKVFAMWWFIWPNITLNFYPWGLSVNQYEPALDPTKTKFHWCQYAWDSAKASTRDLWHMDDVDHEDVQALAETTRGLSSPHARRGRFVAPHEDAIHWFHRRVYEATRSDD